MGYAEIHYRPRGVPSLLYRSMPEIVTDAPARVRPGSPVPVFVFIKDAHRFPVTLSMVVVHLIYDDGSERVDVPEIARCNTGEKVAHTLNAADVVLGRGL